MTATMARKHPASANEKLRPRHGRGNPAQRDRALADVLADHMADGCPSVIEAARRMRLTVADAERIWKRIVRDLGWQAA